MGEAALGKSLLRVVIKIYIITSIWYIKCVLLLCTATRPPPPAPRSAPQLLQHHPPPPPGPSHQATAGTVAAPGHQQVRRLAQGLVELCGKGDVTQEEVEVLVGLWENLLDVDKGRVVYPSCYRAQLTQGGSKTSTANTEAAPGLESMKR